MYNLKDFVKSNYSYYRHFAATSQFQNPHLHVQISVLILTLQKCLFRTNESNSLFGLYRKEKACINSNI